MRRPVSSGRDTDPTAEEHGKVTRGLKADAGRDLVFRLGSFLERVGYRGEVHRLYPDATAREARWAGVVEILNFAENHVRRAAEPSLHGFLEELAG